MMSNGPEIKNPKSKSYTYFIGIDVSKNELDYAVIHDKKVLFHREDKNEPGAILAFVSELKKLQRFTIARALFCMENTGFYCNHLLNSLRTLKANVVVENAYRLKNSLGMIRGKNDKADSIRIAQYAQKNIDELKLWQTKRTIILQLMNLQAIRYRLVNVSVVLKTPLVEQGGFIKKDLLLENLQSCEQSLNALATEIKAINLKTKQLVESDPRLKRLMMLVRSVPGIGEITAIQIIVSTNEFIDFNSPKKFSCYAGIAPFKKQSGQITTRARVSNMANKKVKKLLHTCATVAVTHNKELRAYYKRKTEEDGKSKMSVLNAVRNKLILRIFACVNQDRPYEENYVRKIFEKPADLTAEVGEKAAQEQKLVPEK